MSGRVEIPTERVAEFCVRNHIRKLAIFGSILTDDFRSDSDVDVLVAFDPGVTVGFRILDIEEELSQFFAGHKVDIVSEKYLNKRIRKEILNNLQVAYEKQ